MWRSVKKRSSDNMRVAAGKVAVITHHASTYLITPTHAICRQKKIITKMMTVLTVRAKSP